MTTRQYIRRRRNEVSFKVIKFIIALSYLYSIIITGIFFLTWPLIAVAAESLMDILMDNHWMANFVVAILGTIPGLVLMNGEVFTSPKSFIKCLTFQDT